MRQWSMGTWFLSLCLHSPSLIQGILHSTSPCKILTTLKGHLQIYLFQTHLWIPPTKSSLYQILLTLVLTSLHHIIWPFSYLTLLIQRKTFKEICRFYNPFNCWSPLVKYLCTNSVPMRYLLKSVTQSKIRNQFHLENFTHVLTQFLP